MKKTWQDLKCMPLRERSQSEKTAYCMILTMWDSGKRPNYRNRRKKNQCFTGLREGRDKQVMHRRFGGQ